MNYVHTQSWMGELRIFSDIFMCITQLGVSEHPETPTN